MSVFDLSKIPPIVDVAQVRQYFAPLTRSTLYELANDKKIVPVSVGVGRGKRCYLSSSIAAYLEERIARSVSQPNPES